MYTIVQPRYACACACASLLENVKENCCFKSLKVKRYYSKIEITTLENYAKWKHT